MDDDEQLQIGTFGQLIGLSVPPLWYYDRLQPAQSQQTIGGRVPPLQNRTDRRAGWAIALLRSMDMSIADIRQIFSGVDALTTKTDMPKRPAQPTSPHGYTSNPNCP